MDQANTNQESIAKQCRHKAAFLHLTMWEAGHWIVVSTQLHPSSTISPTSENLVCFQTLLNIPWGQNYPCQRTTDLKGIILQGSKKWLSILGGIQRWPPRFLPHGVHIPSPCHLIRHQAKCCWRFLQI